MRITFVFHGTESARYISGGYRMVYEYARRFSMRGHEVAIVSYCAEAGKKKCPVEPLRKMIHFTFGKIFPLWYKIPKDIKRITAFSNMDVPEADAVIATSVLTAEPVANFPKSKGEKYYFIQDFENWDGVSAEKVYETYKLGMNNIVIADWLKEKLKKHGANSLLVPNAIDCEFYKIIMPIELRKQHSIAMLFHKAPHKGSNYGLEAIYKLKKLYPDMEARLFGVPDKPLNLPDWITYTKKATPVQVRDIYNKSAIFICPSINEGFGLTGAEAMACGCAYVSTDYGGQKEYSREGVNVLLSKPKDVDGMVDNVKKLFNDNNLRIKMAQDGRAEVKNRDWQKSVEMFETILSKDI